MIIRHLSYLARDVNNALTLLLGVIFIFSISACSSSATQGTPEQKFWQWFEANEARLFNLERDRERIFDELQAELHKVNSGLTFEFGPVENGAREFVVSADGIKDVFPSVNALVAAAPQLPRWKVIKFRPRRAFGPITLNGLTLKPEQLQFVAEPDGGKIGLTLFIEGYTESERNRYLGVVFLLLDHALGEYDVETKIGFMEYKDATAKSFSTKQPFSEIAKVVDAGIK